MRLEFFSAVIAVALTATIANAGPLALTFDSESSTAGNPLELIDGIFGAASDNVNTGGSGNGQFWGDESSTTDLGFVRFSFTLPAGEVIDSFAFQPRRRVDGAGTTDQFADRADDFDVLFSTTGDFTGADIISTTTYDGPIASVDELTSVPVDSSAFDGLGGTTLFVSFQTTQAREQFFNLGEVAVNAVPIPEPTAACLLTLGLAGVMARRRRG